MSERAPRRLVRGVSIAPIHFDGHKIGRFDLADLGIEARSWIRLNAIKIEFGLIEQ
jgi:hypothetical protein